MEYFREGFGLVTSNDPQTENCNLFYAQYLTLKNNIPDTEFKFFINNMYLKLNNRGLYNRRSIEENPPRTVSQDEILGFLVASKILNTDHKDIIWEHLITHFGTYDNAGVIRGKIPYNPANFYSWGQIVGSSLSILFLPFFIINLLITCNKKKEDTSGKIMYWLELSNMKESFINKQLYKYYENKMKKQYGDNYLKGLYEIYFWMESRTEFPLFQLVGE